MVKFSDARLMTFTVAEDLCQSFGGRLATYRELSNVRSAGYHLCWFVFLFLIHLGSPWLSG